MVLEFVYEQHVARIDPLSRVEEEEEEEEEEEGFGGSCFGLEAIV